MSGAMDRACDRYLEPVIGLVFDAFFWANFRNRRWR